MLHLTSKVKKVKNRKVTIKSIEQDSQDLVFLHASY